LVMAGWVRKFAVMAGECRLTLKARKSPPVTGQRLGKWAWNCAETR
jgi:hypothetical protein